MQEPKIFHPLGGGLQVSIAQVFSVLKKPYLSTTLKLSMMVAGAQAGTYSISIWLPTYLKTVRGLSVEYTGAFLLVHIFGALLGYLCGAHMADAIGRKRTFISSALGSAGLILVYMFAPLGNTAILLLGAPLGVVIYSMFAPMGSFMTELFPTSVRGCGQGFCYNAGRGIGALFPALTGFMAEYLGLGAAIALFSFASYGVMVIALMTLPETAGRRLQDFTGPNGEVPLPQDTG